MSDPANLPERRARSRKLCSILSRYVSELASPGLGRWPEAWEYVEDVSDRFLDALSEWERTGDEAAMDRAKALSLEVRDAWQEADRRYRALTRSDAAQEVRA